MVKMKPNRKYYFTVEGETERLYLLWLQKQINSETSSTHTVTLDCPVQKNPLKRAKSLVVTGKTVITHVCDYESNEDVHTVQFQNTLNNMKKSEELGKQIKYELGYSNFTFELWIALHRMDCNGHLTHRKHYLVPINSAYEENFRDLDEYKQEANFKRIINKLTLNEVKAAIVRSNSIMKRNEDNGLTLHQYKRQKYYKENPSLSISKTIERILNDCQLL